MLHAKAALIVFRENVQVSTKAQTILAPSQVYKKMPNLGLHHTTIQLYILPLPVQQLHILFYKIWTFGSLPNNFKNV